MTKLVTKKEVIVVCEPCDEKLHVILTSYMKLKSVGIVQTKQFEVKLPWKQNDQQLPESKKIAVQRLFCLEKRLTKDYSLSKHYNAEIKNW